MVSTVSSNREASIVVGTCFGVKSGELVGILSDEDHMQEARALASATATLEATPVILDASDYIQKGVLSAGIPEPPDHIIGLMEKVDVFILKTDMDFAHRFAHTAASAMISKNGGRIASVEEDLGSYGLTQQYILETKERTEKLGAITSKGSRVHVTTQNGTDIEFSIKDRPPLVVFPIRKGGDIMSPLPLWGEIAHSVVELECDGVIVGDGIANVIANSGIKTPIKYTIRKGRAVNIEGGSEAERLRQIIKAADENANILCEFAFGTGQRERWNSVSEKGALGTIHFALGENKPYPGGKIQSKVHMDVTVRHPTVEIDGRIVSERGVLNL